MLCKITLAIQLRSVVLVVQGQVVAKQQAEIRRQQADKRHQQRVSAASDHPQSKVRAAAVGSCVTSMHQKTLRTTVSRMLCRMLATLAGLQIPCRKG